jgi:hypothetical protein
MRVKNQNICVVAEVTSSSVSSSGQKPKAKLRDTFVTQESRTKLVAEAHKASKTEALVNRSERANSLKAIINKHEVTSTAAAAAPPAGIFEPANLLKKGCTFNFFVNCS